MFIADLCDEMVAALEQLGTALPGLDRLKITDLAAGPITLSKHEAAPEPASLRRVKAEVGRRWGTNTGIRAVAAAVGTPTARNSCATPGAAT